MSPGGFSASTSPAVAIVGGGVIGLSCAWRAATAGFAVTVHDPRPGSGASHVAAGMLAPVNEAWPGEEEALALGSASLDRWPGFAAELADAAGVDPRLHTEGTITVGVDAADRAELDRLADHLARLGRTVEVLSGRELRRTEPSLGPGVRRGLSVPGDLAVDNRALLTALLAACRRAGVAFVQRRCTDLAALDADAVVVAAGAHSGQLHPALVPAVRPVKGEILRLRARPGSLSPPRRNVRAVVGGRYRYLVPREGARLVLGATQHEVGFDTDVTVAGVRDLLADAEQVLPGLAEYALEEAAAGLRPGSPDNLPLLGRLDDRVIAATGHHRNGFLLAPVTAEAVVALLRGDEVPDEARAADPTRLPGFPAREPAAREPAAREPALKGGRR